MAIETWYNRFNWSTAFSLVHVEKQKVKEVSKNDVPKQRGKERPEKKTA